MLELRRNYDLILDCRRVDCRPIPPDFDLSLRRTETQRALRADTVRSRLVGPFSRPLFLDDVAPPRYARWSPLTSHDRKAFEREQLVRIVLEDDVDASNYVR